MKRYRAKLVLFFMPSIVTPVAAQHAGHEWSYDGASGPSHWGDLTPEFAACGHGHRQSPIDIRKTEKADLPSIEFAYKPSPLRLIDNGHTIMINYASGSSIRVGNAKYELKQFHFHRPSEEKINGKAYDMVIHLVHADQNGHLAVVAVLLQEGTSKPLIDQLWNHLPSEKEKEQVVSGVSINAADLLPAGHGYYTFDGSLTTPPCSEQVVWFVLKQPVHVSAAEVAKFAKLYPHDARPTEPLNDRVVKESN